MKTLLAGLLTAVLCTQLGMAQNTKNYAPNRVSEALPYGKVNPGAFPQVKDYEPMIGVCDCKSTLRLPDGSWGDSVRTEWRFKYILDGQAVQDENWRENGIATTSIRTFNADSSRWSVTFFSSVGQSLIPRVWQGGKNGDDIVLKAPQKAPNGFDGFSKLTFYEISEDGFRWKGEWVNPDESIVFPFWYIDCVKRKE